MQNTLSELAFDLATIIELAFTLTIQLSIFKPTIAYFIVLLYGYPFTI